MTDSDSTKDPAMLAGMENLIAAMRDRPPTPAVPASEPTPPLAESVDELADAPWHALRATPPGDPGARTEVSMPASIDRYRLLRRLGAGGMGVVYLALDLTLGRKVAIKLLHAERALDVDAQARLLREARALASLQHPNVVIGYEVDMHEEQIYLVMEYIAGQTLREWARGHTMDWRAIVAQYRVVGEGLAAAHQAGIFHRDFKPDNVLVHVDGRPRILDFGLAAPERKGGVSLDALGDVDLTRTGAILGTPAYMAPEQFLGETVDARADQFSFCVALWEALFGHRPFGGRNLVELSQRVIAGRRLEPPRTPVPGWVVEALIRGLSTRPEDRFATMSELLAALAKPPRRRLHARIVVALALVGSLALVAWLMSEPATGEQTGAAAPVASATPAAPAMDVEAPTEESFPFNRALVAGNVLGAKVYVDDAWICETPCEIEVPLDGRTHEVRLTKAGYTNVVYSWRPKRVSEPLPPLPDMKPL